ncbi:glutaredoxin [Plakobranchus ocellatus]|uniref:Glutaredoxin n=1 Tax=Plakobranchus ocellatus TaxID=259542 RepID=A0AAV3YC80_9GAST|nr:glutaredoxin [Plakobranchus ocellatus]
MPEVKQLVDSKIAGKKVMVFSKSTCPFCTKAKKVFNKYISDKILSEDDYEVLEIERLQDCSDIQDYLLKLTGGRSVPRVFVNGKFIGGGDDVVAKDNNGQLKALLN